MEYPAITDLDKIDRWDTKKITEFFRFANLFMKGNPGFEKISTSDKKKVLGLFDFENIPGHPYTTYVHMMGLTTKDNVNKFDYQFRKILKEVLNMVADNPSLVDDDLYELMQINPNYSWALTPKSQGGMEEVAMTTVADAMRIVSDLTRSIKKSDLQKLPTKEKIAAIKQLWPVFELFKKNVRPAGKIISAKNASALSAEELEKGLIDYGDDNN